jgi:hypothetical protein
LLDLTKWCVTVLMDSHKGSTQLERLEVVETGRRRGWSDDEKLRIVTESFSSAARDIVDSKTPWHITFVADDMAALVRSRAD